MCRQTVSNDWKVVPIPRYYKVVHSDGSVRFYSCACDSVRSFLNYLSKMCPRVEKTIVSVLKYSHCFDFSKFVKI